MCHATLEESRRCTEHQYYVVQHPATGEFAKARVAMGTPPAISRSRSQAVQSANLCDD